MGNTAIIVDNLWKGYQLGNKSGNLREVLSNPFSSNKKKEETFWALEDVSFEIKQGEAVGIIGKNGAGKSTLLKILSRITVPTKGSFEMNGRVASLLEVGTGFHPELTGRENIYLNGTILGMNRAEVKSRFDEIVDFSGVEKFIDTPVKRYSSGMYVRLAFAVAAHLEPEILIVDEVLAVGDAEFQKKCLGKMKDASANEGRTVVFVSHNMGTINQLCEKSILLNSGKVGLIGSSEMVTQAYNYIGSAEVFKGKEDSVDEIFIKKIETFNSKNESTFTFSHSENINLRLTIGINNFESFQNIGLAFLTREKNRVFTVNKSLQDFYQEGDEELTVDFIIQGGLIAPMDYSFLVALNTRSGQMTYEVQEDVCPIKVYDDGTDFAFAEGYNYGSIIYEDKWNLIDRK
ncbi:MAG: ABC transporter ATP-binding protein [Flavobacteriales bacterium]|nr:MAG: ABC transporter ATP-binding protein [Flavobacteriales bacterium]